MISDYTYLYKKILSFDEQETTHYDVFISAFTNAERVQNPFSKIRASKKYWLILPEYGFEKNDFPTVKGPESEVISITQDNNGIGGINELIEQVVGNKQTATSLCIDSTGFIRPTLLFLMRLLHQCGIKKYDMLYSEPSVYKEREQTSFSLELADASPICGFEGTHHADTTNDLLIIGAGYEDKLVLQVSESKKHATKKLICGFPPLQADMYQENMLKVKEAEAIGLYDRITVSASDPFETAEKIREIVKEHEKKHGEFNLYLAPLATKSQTLGFGLYYITERLNTATSIIFPFAEKYAKETSEGAGRIWRYSIEIE